MGEVGECCLILSSQGAHRFVAPKILSVSELTNGHPEDRQEALGLTGWFSSISRWSKSSHCLKSKGIILF